MRLHYTSTCSLGAFPDFPQGIKANQKAVTLDRNLQSYQLRKHTETEFVAAMLGRNEGKNSRQRITDSKYTLVDAHIRHVQDGF